MDLKISEESQVNINITFYARDRQLYQKISV